MTPHRSDWLTRFLTMAIGAAYLIWCAAATAQLGASAPLAQAPASKSVMSGVYTVEQATRGHQVYEGQCALCHPLDNSEPDTPAPILVGPDFATRWLEQSVADLLLTTRTSMPTSAPNSLTKETYVDLLAFLLSANRYPAGDTELAPDPAVLAQIIFDKKPPR